MTPKTSASLTIEEEALRRAAIIDAPGFQPPAPLSRTDVVLAVLIAALSLILVIWAAGIQGGGQ